MIQTYQIHATLQLLSLISLIFGSFFARKHKVKKHHRFQYTALILSTLAVSLMIYESRGLPTIHGKMGFTVFIFILFSVISGRLFLKSTLLFGKKITRNRHRTIAIISVLLLTLMILNGLLTFVL